MSSLYTVNSPYLAPVGSQNSRAWVKWSSGPNSQSAGSQSHTVTSALLKPKQYVERWWVLTYISRISAAIDIAPATNHNKPYYILRIMHQNFQIMRSIRRHTMGYVLKPSKPRCGLTGNENGIVTVRGFHWSCMSFLVKNLRITFQITLISALPV